MTHVPARAGPPNDDEPANRERQRWREPLGREERRERRADQPARSGDRHGEARPVGPARVPAQVVQQPALAEVEDADQLALHERSREPFDRGGGRLPVEDPATGETHTTHTTVIHDDAPRSGGGMGLILLLIIVVLAVVAFFIWQNQNNSEVAANNAVAEAANEVGDAAQQAGNAVEDAADNVTNNN